LRNVKLLSKPIKICIAKAGITLTASKVGTIFCITIINGKEIQVTINDVLYVPGLEFNLLSVPKLEANGLAIIFGTRKRKNIERYESSRRNTMMSSSLRIGSL